MNAAVLEWWELGIVRMRIYASAAACEQEAERRGLRAYSIRELGQ